MPKSYIPPRPIIISPYDAKWRDIYEDEKQKILRVIANKIIAIEHIGSTAVPNLAAKPIIDIMVGVKDFAIAKKCIEPLKTIEYEYVPQYEVDIPDRRFFNRGPNLPNQHFHLHMVIYGENFWVTHLLFRDYLRSHPEIALQYQTLKQKLAKQYVTDIMGYCDGKSEFIQNIVRLAIVEEASKGQENTEV